MNELTIKKKIIYTYIFIYIFNDSEINKKTNQNRVEWYYWFIFLDRPAVKSNTCNWRDAFTKIKNRKKSKRKTN